MLLYGVPTSLGTAINNNGASGVFTTNTAIRQGSLVFVVYTVHSSVAPVVTVSSVTDGTNTYTKAASVTSSASVPSTDQEIWFVANATALASGASITPTFSSSLPASSNGIGVTAFQVSNISAVDVTATNSTTSNVTTLSVTSPVLGQALELVIGTIGTQGALGTETVPSGWTNVGTIASGGAGTPTSQFVDYEIVDSTSAVTYAPSWGTANVQIGEVLATFKIVPTIVNPWIFWDNDGTKIFFAPDFGMVSNSVVTATPLPVPISLSNHVIWNNFTTIPFAKEIEAINYTILTPGPTLLGQSWFCL